MKKFLFLSALALPLLMTSCKEDEEKVDPLVGLWELDDATVVFSGFSYYGFENENDLYGESSYTIEFNADFTYEREIDDIPQLGDINDEGEWESDGEEIDLDSDDDEIGGIAYSFDIVEITETKLVVEYTGDPVNLFPDAKIDEWFDDGTINSSGQFTVTDEEFDSLYNNFTVQAQGEYTLEFDKE
ncbi:hypothetical protein [Marinoscillum furvescens]|uniref:Lipocalin-like protein n=1 Tax=Marinoscillum furvescens DSM 4134 TaxID=1122208 RepID=A0A3D9L2P0_MARFU|nr:hypothetical protein [Marinoscillum furvescens]RED98885.1 hypothetical protein C7460_10977 [Marinoscillum furvescens DSM 4134]